ncbi:MAG: peptidylprolyl isomerase [bacterium]
MNNQSSDSNTSVVTLKTSMGDIKLELFPEKAPETVKNFLQYVNDGHYDHTIFHRVIDGFMIQGGGFSPNLSEKRTRESIKNEAHNGLLNTRGTIAMARTQEVHSATSQFFINVVDNAFLDHKGNSPQEYGYCVFGKVVDGMDIVDKIKGVETQTHGPYSDLPCTPIEIVSAKINTGASNCY